KAPAEAGNDGVTPAPDEPGSAAGHEQAAPASPDRDSAEPPLLQIDPRWVAAERISGAIGALGLSVGALVALLIFGAGWRLLGLGAWAAVTVVLVAAAMAAPALQYRRARYRLTPFGIEIRWGVWWRRVTIVPRS